MIIVEEKDILKGLLYVAFIKLESKDFHIFRAIRNKRAEGKYTYVDSYNRYSEIIDVGLFNNGYLFRQPTYEEIVNFEDLEEDLPLKKGKTDVEEEQELSLLIF